ncbi:hypothetical protein D4R42_00850 [bacterium]|nr:MAG: hypothetical protein D4R42_00850 [bacterium]
MTKKQLFKAVPFSTAFTNISKQMQIDYNHISEITDKHVHKINAEKERLFKEKLKAITSEDIDLNDEIQRLFPRIAVKRSDNSEAYFWNDGTKSGKLIIIFYPIEDTIDIHSENRSVKLNCGFRYK